MVLDILLCPKNEKGIRVTKNLNAKLSMRYHNNLAVAPAENKVADVELHKARFVILSSITFDDKEAIG